MLVGEGLEGGVEVEGEEEEGDGEGEREGEGEGVGEGVALDRICWASIPNSSEICDVNF